MAWWCNTNHQNEANPTFCEWLCEWLQNVITLCREHFVIGILAMAWKIFIYIYLYIIVKSHWIMCNLQCQCGRRRMVTVRRGDSDFLTLVMLMSLYFNGLVQERHNSSALAMELRLSCANPSICESIDFKFASDYLAKLALCSHKPINDFQKCLFFQITDQYYLCLENQILLVNEKSALFKIVSTVTLETHYSVISMSISAKISLTHWGRDKLAAIAQTTFSNAFSWMKMYKFWLIFDWSLFPGIQITIFHHWFR